LSFFDPNKVIILLNDSELINGNNYLSHLVERGYYNFTRNAAGINYLMGHPNTLNDVLSYTTNTSNYTNISSDVSNNYGNGSNNGINYVPEKKDNDYYIRNDHQRIIGLQNLTNKAGSTTLMYMMEKQLNYNYNCKAIEMFKQDSIYFHDNNISMCTNIDDLKLKIKDYGNADVIIIDLNGLDGKNVCDEILYLVEPGVIGLNKLLKSNSNIAEKVKDYKVVLNRSSIKDEELSNLEYETKFKIFFNLINYNERKDRVKSVDLLLIKLGFKKQNVSGGLFG
jgi:hypothetical protein